MSYEYRLYFNRLAVEELNTGNSDMPCEVSGIAFYEVEEGEAVFTRCKITDTDYASDDADEPLQGWTLGDIDAWEKSLTRGFNSNSKLKKMLGKYRIDSIQYHPENFTQNNNK